MKRPTTTLATTTATRTRNGGLDGFSEALARLGMIFGGEDTTRARAGESWRKSGRFVYPASGQPRARPRGERRLGDASTPEDAPPRHPEQTPRRGDESTPARRQRLRALRARRLQDRKSTRLNSSHV